MKRKLLGLIALVTLAFTLTACSEPGNHHWRRATVGGQTLVWVYVPPTSPAGGNQADPAFNAALDSAIADWEAHPDLRFIRTTVPCKDNGVDPTAENCIHAWNAHGTYLSDNYGPGVAGIAAIWGGNGHFFNGSPSNPSRIVLHDDWSGQPAGSQVNGWCHEAGHAVGLDHWDDNDDGIPDAAGPCGGPENPHPDQTDIDALDVVTDTCHADTAPAPRASGIVGGDGCPIQTATTNALRTSEAPPDLKLMVEVTTFAELRGD